ncbi:MAG: TPM domain-containing protein [Treponema sp.]|nr:TPM domain-containing protein [Treponema sp.]
MMKRIGAFVIAVAFAAFVPLAAQDDYIQLGDGSGVPEAEYDSAVTGEESDGSVSDIPMYENEDTGYVMAVLDWADLLSDEEENLLLDEMYALTEWGNAIFCSAESAEGSSAQDLAASIYEDLFGYGESGAIFFVDMYRRRLEIHSDGEVYKTITSDYAQTITDNIYRMASEGDYYSCAVEAFRQMATLLAGGRIRQPMKHASNALLALALSLFFCYLYMAGKSRTASEKSQPKAGPVFKGAISGLDVIPGRLTSHVIQSSSGGRGSGHSGGGGGHSGGGGGHSF